MSLFLEQLKRAWELNESLLCVGLDSDIDKIPKRFLSEREPQLTFNWWVIDQTHEFVCGYKPNTAFYESQGSKGWWELKKTVEYIHTRYPDLLVIADAKRGDIGSTSAAYAEAFYDEMKFDAVTVNPYLGREALEPLLAREDKGVIVLCRTSNLGAGEFQDLQVLEIDQNPNAKSQIKSKSQMATSKQLWEYVAEKVVGEWTERGNCMLVAGATYPGELKRVRELVGEMPLLVPGIGAQGGEIEKVMQAGLTKEGAGLVINVSRGVIFAKDPGKAAKNYMDETHIFRPRT